MMMMCHKRMVVAEKTTGSVRPSSAGSCLAPPMVPPRYLSFWHSNSNTTSILRSLQLSSTISDTGKCSDFSSKFRCHATTGAGNSGPTRVGFAVSSPSLPLEDVLEVPLIRDLLEPRLSPFVTHENFGGGFVDEDDRVAISSLKFASSSSLGAGCTFALDSSAEFADGSHLCMPLPAWAIRAGARRTIYFDPQETKVAIVTCGGLCPGLNDVVESLVNKCEDYGVPEGNIHGILYGLKGFYDKKHKPVVLTKKVVESIHLTGGTLLGTSRGGADIPKIVKSIDIQGYDIVFVVGGNGGNAGAAAITEALGTANVPCSVIGVPKSIDNDILLIDRCFGFDTAVEEAQRALISAKVEASSAYRGIGLVKLMGRQSGFLAVNASLASGVVDVCLIPEVPFTLHGPNGLHAYLEKVLSKKGHAVVCVAEGAGQDILASGEQKFDASGNPVLKNVGLWLKSEIKAAIPDVDMKYIDPSYIIRSIPTITTDRIYCKILAHNAVHAAFGGYTGAVVGLVNTHYVYLPIPTVIQAPRTVDPRGKQWNRLRASIGQPNFT